MNATDIIAYAWNADIYCTDCIPSEAIDDEEECSPVFCGAEVDCPQHCCECHEFIEGHSLTSEGKDYVANAILLYLNTDQGKPPMDWLGMAELNSDIYDALRMLPFLARDWHGGQWTDLYKVLSVGLANDLETIRGAIRELQEAYDKASESESTPEEELDDVASTLEALSNF